MLASVLPVTRLRWSELRPIVAVVVLFGGRNGPVGWSRIRTIGVGVGVGPASGVGVTVAPPPPPPPNPPPPPPLPPLPPLPLPLHGGSQGTGRTDVGRAGGPAGDGRGATSVGVPGPTGEGRGATLVGVPGPTGDGRGMCA